MTENADAERHLSQTMTAALSVALNIALQAQYARAERARHAQHENEQRRRETERQLAAERETAAVLWRRVDDREWIRTRPVEVARAWASARAWESLDPRAAEARAKFDTVLGALYGPHHPAVEVARETEDYAALAMLLQRAVEVTPEQTARSRAYEVVPEPERRAWLERQVWGPDADPRARIAASTQLADLDRGLPVTVLREMSPEARQAWIELGELDPEERRAWRRTWLQRQVWGREALEPVRAARAAALEEMERGGGSEALEPEAWHAWVVEVWQRNTRRAERQTAAAPPAGAEHTRQRERTAASAVQRVPAVKERRETGQERLARIAAAVREAWPAEVAGQILARPAFDAVAHRLHQLERRGYDMRDILGMVRADALVGFDRYGTPVRDPAAFAEWHIKQLAASLPEKAATEAGIERLERYVAEHTHCGRTARGRNIDTETTDTAAARTDHDLAHAERDAAGQARDHANDRDVPLEQREAAAAEADTHDVRAVELVDAAGVHEAAAEDLRSGAYDQGAEPAQLAGRSHPRSINESPLTSGDQAFAAGCASARSHTSMRLVLSPMG